MINEFRAFRSEAELFGYSKSVFVFLWHYARGMRWLEPSAGEEV
jgi:hypothetical protein